LRAAAARTRPSPRGTSPSPNRTARSEAPAHVSSVSDHRASSSQNHLFHRRALVLRKVAVALGALLVDLVQRRRRVLIPERKLSTISTISNQRSPRVISH
jgi:hypothetical protein